MMQTLNLSRWVIVAVFVALPAVALSCVSSESGGEDTPAMDVPDGDTISGGSVYVDTISPVPYETFEQVVESENPKKVAYRMMMLREGSSEALSRTVRLALDSLSSADSSLVAARVTFYEIVPIDNMRGNLVARAWGEGIPREGWDAARRSTSPHRSYIYHRNPGWPANNDEQ
jgi:hypothetical protein